MGEGSAAKRLPTAIYLLTFLSAIGGFLFGYDTGVVSGAMLIIRDDFKLNTLWHELIVSATIGAAMLASLGAGAATDRYGRRLVILSASLVFLVGAVVMGAAPEKVTLLVGRIIVGIGIGLASMVVPVYLSEVSPVEIRGRVTVVNNIFITGGQLVSSIISGAFSEVPMGWRYMLGLAGIPALLQLIGSAMMPESPRWLISQGRDADAMQVLEKIRPKDADLKNEIDSIKAAMADDSRQGGLKEVLSSATVRQALLIGSLLQLFQQISGINTVMYYSASIITMAGITDKSLAIWLSAATSSMNFIGTFLGLWLVERLGRRSLTLGSLLGTTVSLFMMAITFQMAYINSPKVTFSNSVSSDCSADTCGVCTSKSSCGYCFMGDRNDIMNSTCVAVNKTSFDEMSMTGWCSNSTLLSDGNATFAYDWCPYTYAWLCIVGLALYLLCFSPGMGPMPWTINSEIYPGWARATCNSITTSINWGSNLLVSLTFLTLTEVLLKHGAYIDLCVFLKITVGLLLVHSRQHLRLQ
ncbi:Proton myo-inositol cotransporter [Chionoecetes opilio]|uniref:Proton myo-inositol cotransporter n=1 Tax=Chionoecetes opilio TaxID=41210 RepID=A0A8J4YWJ5_CHIOP|nr:Proton myo-inositol cotransporter [Chionoecetes opilio]